MSVDAIGLALFAVLGTEVALQLGTTSLIAIIMSVITAVTRGVAIHFGLALPSYRDRT